MDHVGRLARATPTEKSDPLSHIPLAAARPAWRSVQSQRRRERFRNPPQNDNGEWGLEHTVTTAGAWGKSGNDGWGQSHSGGWGRDDNIEGWEHADDGDWEGLEVEDEWAEDDGSDLNPTSSYHQLSSSQ